MFIRVFYSVKCNECMNLLQVITNENIINSLFAYSTDSLMKYEFDSLVYNPDVIKELIFWVEEFKYYKKNDTASFSIIYPSIYDYWMNKIGSCVIQASEKNSDLKIVRTFHRDL